MASVVGWDIGGAHLKAARLENGRIAAAIQIPSPLRFGIERLGQAFAEAKSQIGTGDRHAITMTGELADTFADRREGVLKLTEVAERQLTPAPVLLYAGRAGFVAPAQAPDFVADVASANWYATASVTGQRIGEGLLIDMGSTTTDVVPVINRAVAARGYTDSERMRTGELVYTGMVRTFLMAAARRAPIAGEWTELVHENFANMADVYRILQVLKEEADQMSTADGRAKTIAASQARLARMVGLDFTDADGRDWEALARWFAELQVRAVTDAAMLVVSRGVLAPDAPVVSAGIGTPVVAEVARRLNRSLINFDDLLDTAPDIKLAASTIAPAAAVALLANPA